MFTQRGVYFTVVGSSTLLSFMHYASNCACLVGDIPLHFNFLGKPDTFGSRYLFFLYPVLSAVVAGIAIATSVTADSKAAAPPGSPIEVYTRVSLTSASLAMLCAQFYAVKISLHKATGIPPWAVAAMYASLGLALFKLYGSDARER